MSILPHRWFLKAIIALSFLMPSISFSQVIKEKVSIAPKPVAVSIPTTAPPLKLIEFGTTGYYDFVRTIVPGVVVNGVLTVTSAQMPPRSALEIFVGGSKVFKIYKTVNGCGGSAGEAVNLFPIRFVSCGIVSMSGNSWSPNFASCLPLNSAALARAEMVGPTSAKLTVEADFIYGGTRIPWKAVLELTASLDAEYQPSQVKVEPGVTELVDAGSTTVNVEVRNGAGELMTDCNSPIMVTANLQAQGPYAYLQYGIQAGSSISFPLSGGKASINLVLDPTKGKIPECSETVTLTAAVGGVSGTATVNLKCAAFDHFKVSVSPDTIEHGESAVLTVIAQDANNNEVTIEGNTSIAFAASPAGFGTFLLEGVIPYSQARAGLMRFVSKDQILPSPGFQQVQITASGAGKSGGGTVIIKNKPCEDAPQCPDVPAVGPTLSVLPQPSGFGGIYVCNGRDDLGGFKAISSSESDKFIQPIAAVPCFDVSSNKLRFSVAGNSVQLNAVMDLCDDNIKARGQRLIFDLSEIAAADSCLALQDLRRHYHYPVDVMRHGGYMMADILMMHEMKHKLDYEAIVRAYQGEVNRIFGYFQISCKSVTDIAVEQKRASAKMTSIIAAIVNGIIADANMKWGAKGSAQRQTYEEVSTHGSLMVTLLIDSRIEELKAKYHCP